MNFIHLKGGIAVYVEEVASCAISRGHEFEVWAPLIDNVDYSFNFLLRGLPNPCLGTQSWLSRIKLARHLIKNKKNWLDATLYLPDPGPIRTWMYLNSIGVPKPRKLIITLHGSEILNFTAYAHRRRLFWKLLKTAHRIGVVSRYNKKLLLQIFPDLSSKVIVTSGALRRQFSVIPKTQPDVPGKIVILTVGRVSPRKGQLQFVKALGHLPENLKTKIIYRLAGPAISKSYLRKTQKIAKNMGINLEYQGETSQDQLVRLYSSSDVFALTSIYYKKSVEGFGLVFLEASAHGLPVIATRSGGIEDAVLDNRTGILLPVHQQDTWPEKIMRMITDSAMRNKMSAEGVKWANNFSWDFVVEKLFEI